MFEGQTTLLLWLGAFVGSHFLLSHPLRRPIAGLIGERLFLGLYTVVSLATFIPALMAYAQAPRTLLFMPPAWMHDVAAVVMLPACILLAGSLLGNPAFPGQMPRRKPAPGVFAITRHPMMWAIALWAAVHALANGDAPTVWLCLAMALLALLGVALQDGKKEALLGLDWTAYIDRTSYWPFGRQLRGRLPWRTAWPGLVPVLAGLALYLALGWSHAYYAGVPVWPQAESSGGF